MAAEESVSHDDDDDEGYGNTHHCISSGFITDGQHLPHLLLLLLEHRSASHELVPHFSFSREHPNG
jgi:hypothetical protein